MILASFQVRCDWCHRACSPSSNEGYVHAERWDAAIAGILAAATSPDRARPAVDVGGPPGHPLHLCAACADRGRPPVRLPEKAKRKPKPAGQLPPSMPSLPDTTPSLFDHQEVGTTP